LESEPEQYKICDYFCFHFIFLLKIFPEELLFRIALNVLAGVYGTVSVGVKSSKYNILPPLIFI